MVSRGAPAGPGQARGLFLGGLAGGGVDDGRAAPLSRASQHFGEQDVHPGLALGAALHLAGAQGQVGAGETLDHLRGVGGQTQPRQDLVADHGRGRGGAGQHPGLRQLGQELAELQILGPEVVAPLADAVGLVHGDERTVQIAEQGAKTGEGQALGRDVNQLVLAAGHGAQAPLALVRVQGGGQIGGGQTALFQGGDLVVHQRDERRDDQGGTREQRAGQLIHQALAATGGRHQQQAAGLQQGFDRLALAGTEIFVSQLAQAGIQVGRGVFLMDGVGHGSAGGVPEMYGDSDSGD